MTTENWRESFKELREQTRSELPSIRWQLIEDFISTLLSKERNEAYEKGFTTGRQGVELECKEAMKLNYWDKEKRNEVIDEVKEEVEKNRGGFYEDSECGYALSIIENLKVK